VNDKFGVITELLSVETMEGIVTGEDLYESLLKTS
jgi:hypothetical protein